MRAAVADERSPLPGPTRPPSAPPTSFPSADRRRVVLADDPSEAGFSGAGPEYAGMYLHARYFDPQLGTFLSPDPIGIEGGLNQYGYGFGNPVGWTDRSGLASQVCYIMPPASAGCGTNPSCTNPAPNVQCWTTDEHVNVPMPPGESLPPPPPNNGIPEGSPVPTGPDGTDPGGHPGGTPGNPNCTGADCVPPEDPPPTKKRPPDPVNWWAEFGNGALREAFVNGVFGEGECGRVFFEATRDALNPFSPSAASFGEPVALVWGAQQYNAILLYAASRPNYLGGTGLVYPMKSSVFRAGLQAAKLKAASGPVLGANFAIYQGLYAEVMALSAGQCR